MVGSRPDTLLHNFATLLPGATSSDFQRIVELKVGAETPLKVLSLRWALLSDGPRC